MVCQIDEVEDSVAEQLLFLLYNTQLIVYEEHFIISCFHNNALSHSTVKFLLFEGCDHPGSH